MNKKISIIGAGLSGCEAALVLARNGFQVTLYDQKPSVLSSAYVLPSFAELVCNNVFAPLDHNTPLGLLLSELTVLRSPLIELASSSRLMDDKYLSVNKKGFSCLVTEALDDANIHVVCRRLTSIPEEDIVILASGPLTNDDIVKSVSQITHTQGFHFTDASSIVVDIESVDINNTHFSKLSDDCYIVELSQTEFNVFYEKLLSSKSSTAHIEEDRIVFEECQSLENIARGSKDDLVTRKFTTPIMPGICFILRRENGLENGFIISGFMTTLRHADQVQVIKTLPGFENVRFVRYGRAHRNTYFDAPCILDSFYKVKNRDLFIVGQLSGVDGYAPCISSGFVAAQRIIHGPQIHPFPKETMVGGLAHYVSNKSITEYRPMGPSYSLLSNSQGVTEENAYFQSKNALCQYICESLS